MRQLFLIHVWGDVDPIVSGPYENEDKILSEARRLHAEDEGCIFALDVTVKDGKAYIGTIPYTDEELGGEDEEGESLEPHNVTEKSPADPWGPQ